MCRSRRELSNAYLLAKFRFDTAENEPCKVCRIPRSPGLLLHGHPKKVFEHRARGGAILAKLGVRPEVGRGFSVEF